MNSSTISFANQFNVSLKDKSPEQLEIFEQNVKLHQMAFKKANVFDLLLSDLGASDLYLMGTSHMFETYPCKQSWMNIINKP